MTSRRGRWSAFGYLEQQAIGRALRTYVQVAEARDPRDPSLPQVRALLAEFEPVWRDTVRSVNPFLHSQVARAVDRS